MIGSRAGFARKGAAALAAIALFCACKKKEDAKGAAAGSDKKPIVIGITADASGQYANSGDSDKRGIIMAIQEFNARGGVLGRPIKWD